MASSNEDPNRQRSQDDNTNPFIAFRRFADEQMSTLFNSVFGLHAPSSSSFSDRATKDYQAWLQEARESRDRIDREAEEMGKIMDVYTRAHSEQREQESPWDAYMKSMKEQQEQDSAQDDTQRPTHDDEEPLRCPYRPVEREVPVERYGHSTGFSEDKAHGSFPLSTGLSISFPCDAFSILGEQFNSSPITYLLYGPYSPIRLEQHQMFKDQDVHWREAFEDLLAVQSGQDIGTECTNRPDLSKAEWVREMIVLAVRQRERERKVEKRQEAERTTSTAIRRKPGFLDRFADSRQPENDADEDEDEADDDFDEDDDDEDDDEEATELDLYERFLDSKTAASMIPSIAQSASRSFAQLRHDSTPAETTSSRPSILSTLTTTERVTLPDGTVNTKVVLKKKFSDGREESTETVHTQNAVPQAQSRVVAKGNKKDSNQNEANEKKSKVPAGPSPNIPLSPGPIPIDKDAKTERLKDIFDCMTALIPSLDFSPEEWRLLKVYVVEKVIELKEKKDAGSEKGLTKEWKNTLKNLEEMREAEEGEGKGDEEEAGGMNGGKTGL